MLTRLRLPSWSIHQQAQKPHTLPDKLLRVSRISIGRWQNAIAVIIATHCIDSTIKKKWELTGCGVSFFIATVFPSMTPSMFYSIHKPCYSLQTTSFPFPRHQQPPILISSQSLSHPLFPHKPLCSTCLHIHVQMRFISINHHETPIPLASPLYSHLSHPTVGICPYWLQMS